MNPDLIFFFFQTKCGSNYPAEPHQQKVASIMLFYPKKRHLLVFDSHKNPASMMPRSISWHSNASSRLKKKTIKFLSSRSSSKSLSLSIHINVYPVFFTLNIKYHICFFQKFSTITVCGYQWDS